MYMIYVCVEFVLFVIIAPWLGAILTKVWFISIFKHSILILSNHKYKPRCRLYTDLHQNNGWG